MNFPPRIGAYTFSRELSLTAVSPDYQFALYVNPDGREAICKLWTPSSPARGERELANETTIYHALSSQSVDQQFPDIHIPTALASGSSATGRYMLVEYYPGEYLSATASKAELLVTYQRIIEYFHRISTNDSFLAQVSERRTAWQLGFFFLIHLGKAILKKPGLIGVGLSSLWPVSRGLWEMGRSQVQTFVHRDLGGYNNTLKQADRVIVIDFQLGCLTHPLMEWANIVATRKNDPEFLDVFFASPVWTQIAQDRSQHRIFLALAIYGAMLNIGVNDPQMQVDSIQLLKRLLSL